MSQPINQYVQTNQQRLLDELKDFLRIPSVSTLPEHKPDVDRAAQFVADSLTKAGLENVEIIPTAKHPLGSPAPTTPAPRTISNWSYLTWWLPSNPSVMVSA